MNREAYKKTKEEIPSRVSLLSFGLPQIDQSEPNARTKKVKEPSNQQIQATTQQLSSIFSVSMRSFQNEL